MNLWYMIYGDLQAGPGTIAEAMIRGLPIILNGYIAGQVILQSVNVVIAWFHHFRWEMTLILYVVG